MTYRKHSSRRVLVASLTKPSLDRGQGLNNAMIDAENLCAALELVKSGKPLQEAISEYEKEVVDRGHEAVVLSTQNSLMLLDWSQLKDSPMLKYGTSKVSK